MNHTELLLHTGTNQGVLIASVAVVSSIAAIIALLLLIIGFCHCCFCHKRHKVKKRKKPRPRKPTPPPKELYYNLRPSIKQEQSMELSEEIRSKHPIVMYDDVIPRSKQDSDFDLLEKPKRPVAMYDDILSPSEQDLKEQNIIKPKVMYDEVLPPSEQVDTVDLKRNTAYHPTDLK